MLQDLSNFLHGSAGKSQAVLYSILFAVVAILVGLFIHWIVSLILRRWHHHRQSRGGRVRLELSHLKAPLRLLFPAGILAAVIPFLQFPPGAQKVIERIIILLVIAGFGWLTIRIVYIIRDMILHHYDIDQKDNLRARELYTQVRVIDRVVAVMIILTTIAVMLMTFPAVRKLGISLLASAGVVGIILGLAAQKTLGNLLSGIQIALAQPIRIDDVVIVENEWGRIEEITLTYVVIRIWDLRRLIVPISYFVEQPFQNWTRVSADLLKTVYVYADYRLPVSEVRDELKRLLDASEYWDKKVWNLQVTNSTDRTMELRALMSAADSSAGWNLQCEIREKLIDFLQQRFPEYLPRVRLEMDTRPDQTDEDKAATQEP